MSNSDYIVLCEVTGLFGLFLIFYPFTLGWWDEPFDKAQDE